MAVESRRLLERSGELAQLREAIASARDGRGTLVIFEGPAGIGKTTLLDAARELSADSALRVLSARAGELEVDIAWNVVRQLFTPAIAGAERERLMHGAVSLAAPALGLQPGDATGALHGLYWLVSELAEEAPTLIAVDDVQWADAASLGFLAYLGERVADLRVVVVGTIRSGEALPDALSVLTARPACDVVRVRALSAEASAGLTREVLGPGAEDAFCAACHQATGGNPFLLHELLEQLRREGVPPSAERADEVGGVTPGSVVRSVLVRLSRVSAQARELANAVAVLGDAALREAAALAHIDMDQAAEVADDLARLNIVRPGPTLGFAHPVVREVIYRDLPEHRRARLHHAAARMLADQGEPRRAVSQLLLSEPQGEEWVVELLRDAGEQALGEGAPASAADMLRRALREPPAHDEKPEILVALARAEAAAGTPGGAERLDQALELTSDPRRRAEILLERGRLLYLGGQPGAAAEAFEVGMKALGDGADPSLVALLQAGWLTAARLEMPLRVRAEQLTYAIAGDPPPGDTYGERALLAHVAGQLTFDAEPSEQALELARRAVADGLLIRDETSDGVSWIAAMGALGWNDDFDGFEALSYDALEDARRRGSVLGFATAAYALSFSHYYRGMLADAIADAEQAVAAEREGWRHFLSAALGQLAWALIERGELDAAAAHLKRAEADVELAQTSAHALVLEARSRIELLRGDPRAALATALEAGRVATEARITNPSIFPWRGRAAIAAGALGQRDEAEELLEEELRLARRAGAPRPVGVALIAAGTVRGNEGVEALEEAVDILADSPAKLEHARALVLHGAALRRRGKVSAARDRLTAGYDAAASLGATLIEERARAELSAIGVRPRRARLSGAEALTPAELRVASAAVNGMTNREIAESLFLSLRTVETHLTHTYQKLGIQARKDLAGALRSAAHDD